MTIWFSASCSLTILPNSVGLPALPLRMTSVDGSKRLTILPSAWVSERAEQGGGAVPVVIAGHGLAAPGLDRQPRLGAVERLDLAFLVEREHHGTRRRIEIEADDVGELGLKAGI